MNIFGKSKLKLKTEEAHSILFEFNPEIHDHTDLIIAPKPGKFST